MKTARLPYTWYNIVIAGLALLTVASYWLKWHSFTIEMAEQARRGARGEAAFIILIPLAFLGMYAAVFSLVALLQALRRGSEPMSVAAVLLGLLPMWLWLLLRLWLLFRAS
jgi:hypothetical protein